MENHSSNPAGRLWLFFSAMINGNPAGSIVQHYAFDYFGSNGVDERFMSGMAGLMSLPGEAEEMVSRLGDDAPLPASKLLRPLTPARDTLRADPLCAQQVAWLRSQIDGAVLSDLETTSHILDKYVVKAKDIDEDTLASIRELAEQIITLARDDESLDPEARATVIRFASRIVNGVDLYDVSGPQALVDELDRFYSDQRRVKPKFGEALRSHLKRLVGTIVVATELFVMPVNVSNAVDSYDDLFALSEITEAPATFDEDSNA